MTSAHVATTVTNSQIAEMVSSTIPATVTKAFGLVNQILLLTLFSFKV